MEYNERRKLAITLTLVEEVIHVSKAGGYAIIIQVAPGISEIFVSEFNDGSTTECLPSIFLDWDYPEEIETKLKAINEMLQHCADKNGIALTSDTKKTGGTRMKDSYIMACAIPALFGLMALGLFGIPKYMIWQQKVKGQAELARAEQNRKIAVKEAEAKKEAAQALAEAGLPILEAGKR